MANLTIEGLFEQSEQHIPNAPISGSAIGRKILFNAFPSKPEIFIHFLNV
jgi:hypothetical protein